MYRLSMLLYGEVVPDGVYPSENYPGGAVYPVVAVVVFWFDHLFLEDGHLNPLSEREYL